MAAEHMEERQRQETFPAGAVIYAAAVMLGAILTQMAAIAVCALIYYLLMLPGTGGGSMAELSGRGFWGIVQDAVNEMTMFLSFVYAVATMCWSGYFYLKNQTEKDLKKHIRRILQGKRLFALAALGFGADIVMSVAVSLIAQAFPAAFEHYIELMEGLNADFDVWTVLYVVIFGPLAEELLFRGMILGKLEQAFSFWEANLLQAVCFGIFHMNLVQGIYAFCFGLILGLVVQVTGTVCASMTVHIVFNGTSELLSLAKDDPGAMDSVLWMGILIAAVICFISGFRYFWSEYHKRS